MTAIRITSLRRVTAPWSKHDNRLIARFDVEVMGIAIFGAMLLQDREGMFKANGPRGSDRRGGSISTHIKDRRIQYAVTEKAVAVYREACRMPGGRWPASTVAAGQDEQ